MFRSALALLAVATLASRCASSGAVPKPFPKGPTSARSRPEGPSGTGTVDNYALTSTALSLRGTPYRSGGDTPAAGFDCSGFTQFVFAQYGIRLPREVKDQFEMGKPVKPADVMAGDLLFFATTGRHATHVGIAVGGDEFVHAPSSTGVVRVERLSQTYWSRRYLGARRID